MQVTVLACCRLLQPLAVFLSPTVSGSGHLTLFCKQTRQLFIKTHPSYIMTFKDFPINRFLPFPSQLFDAGYDSDFKGCYPLQLKIALMFFIPYKIPTLKQVSQKH